MHRIPALLSVGLAATLSRVSPRDSSATRFVILLLTKGCFSVAYSRGIVILVKAKATSRKALEKYEDLRKQRSVEVERVCGQIKGNRDTEDFCCGVYNLSCTVKISNCSMAVGRLEKDG